MECHDYVCRIHLTFLVFEGDQRRKADLLDLNQISFDINHFFDYFFSILC